MRNTLHIGDVRQWAKTLPAQSIQTIVTSPPYFGLRSYLDADHPDKAHEMGSEPTPAEFVAALVDLFRDLRTALREDGTLWLNLGDSYWTKPIGKGSTHDPKYQYGRNRTPEGCGQGRNASTNQHKNLIGIPWRVALALQADGWYLRSDIIWHKPNPMPESVTDRPTRSHEYVFLLSKRPTYYYDAAAIAERATNGERFHGDYAKPGLIQVAIKGRNGRGDEDNTTTTRNKRTVWTIPTAPYPNSHFATFPPDLIRPCILAGTSEKGACASCGAPWRRVVVATGHINKREPAHVPGRNNTKVDSTGWAPTRQATQEWAPSCTCTTTETRPCIVSDPFAGSGTTGQVCVEEGRDYLLCDLDERARGWLAGRLAALPVARLAGL